MGRIQDILKTSQPPVKTTTKPVAPAPTGSSGRIQNILQSKVRPTTTPPVANLALPKEKSSTVGKIFNILLAPQRATSGVIQKQLQNAGLLSPTIKGSGVVEGVKNKTSNIDTLTQLGEQNKFQNPLIKAITGQYTPTTSVLGNFWHELPKAAFGTVADIVLDPTVVLSKVGAIEKATTGIGKGIETVAKTASENIPAVQKIGSALERLLVTRGGQSEAFKSIDRTRIIEESIAASNVPKLVSGVIEAPRAIQQRVAQVIKGGITTNSEIAALAKPIRQEFDRVGKAISELAPKLLSPEKYAANAGKYFPRLYTTKEFPTDEVKQFEQLFASTPLSGPNARFKSLKNIPEEIRKEMGQIKEAGFPSLKGLTELGVKEQRLKAFDAYVKSGVPKDEAIGNLVQLPDNKGLGSLAGKFVPPADANAIMKLSKVPSVFDELYGKGLSAWKTFKTAFNPATIARNDLTNYFILNPLGGVGIHRFDVYAKAISELKNEGPIYQRAVKQGLNLSTQEAAELTTKTKQLYNTTPGIKKFFSTPQSLYKKVQEFYGSQDKFFKLANFAKGITEDGLTDAAAMSRAQFYLVNYAEVPEFISWLRKSPLGIPFISFTYGVSKPLAKTLLTHPEQLSKYVKILNGIASINPTHDTKSKIQSEQVGLPAYQQGYGKALRLPFKDKFGRTQYLDLQYILPFNILEAQGVTPGLNPLVSIMGDLARNKSQFTGQQIWKDGADTPEIYNSVVNYLQNTILPPLSPGIPTKVGGLPKYGGAALNKVIDALKQRPEANVLGAKPRQLPQTLLEVLGGLKTNPVNPAQNIFRLKSNSAIFNALKLRVKSAAKNVQLTPAERRVETQRLIDLLKKEIETIGG